MKEPDNGGLPPVFAALERYCAPELLQIYNEARDAAADFEKQFKAAPEHFAGRIPTPYQRRYTLTQACDRAWRALRRDFVNRLARGELVAFALIEGAADPAGERVSIPAAWWRLPHRFPPKTNQARFGERLPQTIAHDILIYAVDRAGNQSSSKPRHGESQREAIRLLEEHRGELVKTNGLTLAAADIAKMLKGAVKPNTVERYIRDRYRELLAAKI